MARDSLLVQVSTSTFTLPVGSSQMIVLQRNLNQRFQSLHPTQYGRELLFLEFPQKRMTSFLPSAFICHAIPQQLELLLALVKRFILNSKSSDRREPRCISITTLQSKPQVQKQTVQIGGLDGTRCAVLRSVLYVVEVPYNLVRQLQNWDKASSGAKRIHRDVGWT
jgi:hypothetical protein